MKTVYDQMKGGISNFIIDCQSMDFGKVKLSKMKSSFYRRFSNAILSFCRTLPESLQTDAMLFLMQYSGLNPGDKLDFFCKYYPPVWSILYWLNHDHTPTSQRLKKEDVTNAVTAQSMAMFLHSLDDHLMDGQISLSYLTLLLRSQAWAVMTRAFRDLAEGVPAGDKTVRRFVDDYCASFQETEELKSLDGYCDLFRRQMAIGMVAPILLTMKRTGVSDFTRDMEIAYGSFGIAWRLLDDIRDIGDDIKKGSHSAIYFCLPEKVRNFWNHNPNRNRVDAEDSINVILDHILEHSIIDSIKERICAELEAAASMAEAHNVRGLAREFRCLAHPLRNRGST
jgi:hypothetical protein